ncbi:MAG TPA: T9SS type A sorting domain-containing protein, partial [Draconibacterium sp.]|nr:T9SS type A sorting domain-containing protein [Draconibacterium sp.]
DWEYGAFNANTESGNEFDYGWGKYNMTSHYITGDSIFIIQLASGNFKKFIIQQKKAVQNVWTFKYADLDGQNDTTITINAGDYKGKTFIHYSIANNMVVEQEPSERWQLLFTKYIDYEYNPPYNVSGVLANAGVKIQQVNGVSQSEFIGYQTTYFNDTLSQIGSDWKSFNMNTFQYEIANDIVYFVQDTAGTDKSIWKLYFTGFSGSGTGTYSFIKTKMITTGISNISERNLTVYPNPANQEINVIHDFSGDTEITVYNISGQPVLKSKNTESAGLNKNTLNIGALPAGLYSLHVRSGNEVKTVKFLKK